MPRSKVTKARAAGKAATGPMTGMVRARIDPALKAEAERVLDQLGLSASDAIRVLYRQVALRRGLPFDLRIPNAATRKALRDADAGRNLTRYDNVDAMFDDLGI